MKIFDRGFWISKLFVYQSLIYYFLYALRFRSFLWFSAGNPGIPMGGMLDEKKSDIYHSLPERYLPKTLLITNTENLEQCRLENQLKFPLIIKPDIGFKGFNVNKVNTKEDLSRCAKSFGDDPFLIQEYVAFKNEFSLMFYKGDEGYGISSLVEKSYPFVIGDGVNCISILIQQHKNPFIQKQNLLNLLEDTFLNSVPLADEHVIIETIGNYSRGAKFHSLMESITPELCEKTDQYFAPVQGLHFFRIDFKSDSLVDYIKGNFKILEINGAKSEPLHIYDKNHSVVYAIKAIHEHWMRLVSLVKEQYALTYDFPSTRVGWKSFVTARKIGK